MQEFVEEFLDREQTLKILDVGSRDVTGGIRGPQHKVPQCYNPIFENASWTYTGVDIEAGANVDVVAPGLYAWGVPDEEFDVVISGQTLEHVKNTHKFMEAIANATKPKGIVCIIAPWKWPQHRFPIDCWRILPDGMTFLLEEISNLSVVKVWKANDDCIGIARK
jgi:SAM-dependent methyltransferase